MTVAPRTTVEPEAIEERTGTDELDRLARNTSRFLAADAVSRPK